MHTIGSYDSHRSLTIIACPQCMSEAAEIIVDAPRYTVAGATLVENAHGDPLLAGLGINRTAPPIATVWVDLFLSFLSPSRFQL